MSSSPPFLTNKNKNINNRRCWFTVHYCSSNSDTTNTKATDADPLQIDQNDEEITEIEMTQHALSIVNSAIASVNPYTAVQSHMTILKQPCTDNDANPRHADESNNNDDGGDSSCAIQIGSNVYQEKMYDRIVLVSFGKASSAMANAVLDRLQEGMPQLMSLHKSDSSLTGIVIAKDNHITPDELAVLNRHGICVQEASHPLPDERSVQGATKIQNLLQSNASERTLVVCCISGGGSALCCAPKPPLNLRDLQQSNEALLQSGLDIKAMNVIRKRLELLKGGQLAKAAYPSTVVTLVLSDVLNDPLDLIASGPTVPDTSTKDDALQLIQTHAPILQATLPRAVLDMLQKDEQQNENNVGDEKMFAKCSTVLVGNNELAVTAAAKEAQKLGYYPIVLSTCMQGEAQHVATVLVSMAHYLSLQRQGRDISFPMSSLPAAIISGGETTVTLNENKAAVTGKGGRNQELALSAALQLHQLELARVVVASVGTDGTDGPTDAAGAVVDCYTVNRSSTDATSAVDALQRHDAYTYFSQFDEDDDSSSGRPSPLIKTGPTGTNVADVCVMLVR